MFGFLKRVIRFDFIRKRFFKTEDEKFEIIEQDIKELNNLLTTFNGLSMKKSSPGQDRVGILKQQKSVISSCKKLSQKIESNTTRYGHAMFKEEEKEALLLTEYIQKIDANADAQIKNPSDTRLVDEEKALTVKIGQYIKDLDEKIKKIIYKLVYVSTKEFGPEVEKILGKFPFVREVLEKYNEEFELKGSNPELQKEFVHTLIQTINKIPPTTWGFTFSRALQTNSINCSASSALLCMLLQPKKFKIPKIEYAAPSMHAIAIVTFSDNTRYYCDPRLNIFECLEGNIKQVLPIGPVRLYILNHPTSRIIYTAVPAMSLQHGITYTYLNNIRSMNYAATQAIEKAKTQTPDETLQEELRQAELFVDSGYQNKLKQIAGSFEQRIDQAMKQVSQTKEFAADEKNMKFAWVAFGELKLFVEQHPETLIPIKSHIKQIEKYLLFETNDLVLPNNKKEQDFLINFRKKEEKIYADNPERYKEMITFICEYIKYQNW